jgi:acyl carrier protein
MGEVLASNDVRTLIAHQLGVDVKRVTDEAHFTDDLGADWLDGLELMIVIGDGFADVVITDEDADQLEVVGDLIRHFENVDNERRRPSTVEAPLQ